jgi:aryl-alcohol dehydrogenase-like predicted oxidoreductase
MQRRALGRSGLDVSVLCLGTMTFGWSADEATSFRIMSEALERGINFFDTADIYSRWSTSSYAGKTEEIMGRWLEEDRSRRDKIVLATKVRGQMSDDESDQGLSRAHIHKSIESSLRRLKTDRIDLYQAHWFDETVQQEETLQTFEELIKSGKVRAIGCSNYSNAQLHEALEISAKHGLHRYESVQPQYSLLERGGFEREVRATCIREQIAVIPYSPLAGGFLTGKYTRGGAAPAGSRGEHSRKIAGYMADPRSFDLLDRLSAMAHAKHATAAQVALAWVLASPAVTSAIVGANTVEQLRDVLGAADLTIHTDDYSILENLTVHAA